MMKATAGHGTRPNPKVVAPQAGKNDEADEDELAELIRRKVEQAAIAKNSSVHLLLDPKKILDFIGILVPEARHFD